MNTPLPPLFSPLYFLSFPDRGGEWIRVLDYLAISISEPIPLPIRCGSPTGGAEALRCAVQSRPSASKRAAADGIRSSVLVGWGADKKGVFGPVGVSLRGVE